MKLNIDTNNVVAFTNKLERIHRSALPVAIRSALNKVAFDVKQNTMPKSADAAFKNRVPNFFKANSRVEMATGFDIGKMKSVVGFTSQSLTGSSNYAVNDLEQQEHGGSIKHRSFIPTNTARGGNEARPVRPGNRLSSIKNIIHSNTGSGNQRQNFIAAVKKAGVGGFVIGNNSKKILWRIDGIAVVRGRLKIRKKPIYTFEEGRSVNVRATGFMQRASYQSSEKLEDFYVAEAKRQIERILSK
jgi:hypothetical protein